ncbi:MAG: lecithin retinol acyltransferase family protein [Gammaproteobacteria bacterium]
MKNLVVLQAGDLIRRRKGLVWHWGVYLGPGRVLHNTPVRGEHVSTMEAYADGETVERFSVQDSDRPTILARAANIAANPKQYSYLWRNCEHTVVSLYSNEERSPTVEMVSAVLLLGVGFVALASLR